MGRNNKVTDNKTMTPCSKGRHCEQKQENCKARKIGKLTNRHNLTFLPPTFLPSFRVTCFLSPQSLSSEFASSSSSYSASRHADSAAGIRLTVSTGGSVRPTRHRYSTRSGSLPSALSMVGRAPPYIDCSSPHRAAGGALGEEVPRESSSGSLQLLHQGSAALRATESLPVSPPPPSHTQQFETRFPPFPLPRLTWNWMFPSHRMADMVA